MEEIIFNNIPETSEAKVVLLGDSGVGKTSIINQFANDSFDPNVKPSMSNQFATKIVNISDINQKVIFEIWDTAGQEKYRSLAKIFYKDARIIIFVYEITNRKSFESLQQYWYQQVNLNCLGNAIFALVGNKNDLYNRAEVKNKEAEEWANSIDAIFQTTSALTNTGINELFDILGKKYFNPKFNYKSEESQKKELYEKKKNRKKEENIEEENNNVAEVKKMKLDNKNHNKKKNKKCC